ncbi:hypothetical protein D3C84_823100 [compost metagenome]
MHLIRMGQIAIHLISGDMVEAESALATLIQTIPISPGRFQQHIGANDIGFDEIGRPGDGTIDVTLGGQVHYGIGLMRGKYPVQLGAVADIHLLEGITLAGCHVSQRLQIARIGEFIEVDDSILRITDDVVHNGRADKAGATSHKDFHID